MKCVQALKRKRGDGGAWRPGGAGSGRVRIFFSARGGAWHWRQVELLGNTKEKLRKQ